MMNPHSAPRHETGYTNFSIPLLDDGFDTGEEEVLDDSDLHSYILSNHEEEVSL